VSEDEVTGVGKRVAARASWPVGPKRTRSPSCRLVSLVVLWKGPGTRLTAFVSAAPERSASASATSRAGVRRSTEANIGCTPPFPPSARTRAMHRADEDVRPRDLNELSLPSLTPRSFATQSIWTTSVSSFPPASGFAGAAHSILATLGSVLSGCSPSLLRSLPTRLQARLHRPVLTGR